MYQSLTKIVTFRLRSIIFSFFVVFLVTGVAGAVTITTMTVKEMAGVSTANYPLTFGHVFKKGDVTGHVYLNNYPTQTDVKTTYDDGSIRFAVVSALIPMTANSDTVLNINTTGTAASATPMGKDEILATDIGATIDLIGVSGSGYSGNLQADLRATITAASSLKYWLEGGICTEILIDQRLNNSLNATWEVRFYPGTSFIRISHAMENVEVDYRGNIDYAVEIKQGNAVPTTVYSKAYFQHNINSRWRKVIWLGIAPPEVEIHYDIDYLISTGHIPNYDTSLTVPEATISEQYSEWEASDKDIMGNGIVHYYFPATGGRQEIGIFPTWTARYLLSMDNRMKEIMLNSAEMTAGCPSHYRESDNTKSFFGHVISLDDRPTMELPDGELPSAIGDIDTPWTIDRSHQGSFPFIPYLITGERFYLDELFYWGGYDLAKGTDNSDYGHDGANGLIRDQIRGEAWAFRNVVHAAIMSPDGDVEKAYFNDKIGNNIAQWNIDILRYPLRYWDVNKYSSSLGEFTSDVKHPTEGWQNDFMAIVLRHASRLGYDVSNIRNEHSKYIINRFSHPDFNWYAGTSYKFPAVLQDGSDVQTWAQAKSLYSTIYTSFPNPDYSYSYRYIALAGLSAVDDQPGSSIAMAWLLSKVTTATSPTIAEDPTWALTFKNLIDSPTNLMISND